MLAKNEFKVLRHPHFAEVKNTWGFLAFHVTLQCLSGAPSTLSDVFGTSSSFAKAQCSVHTRDPEPGPERRNELVIFKTKRHKTSGIKTRGDFALLRGLGSTPN